jgi:excisionase family DNA binding protein
MSEEQVLTIKEIAEILKLAEKTVYSMAQDGELPTFKVRGQWRIRKVDFEKWMAKQAATRANQPSPQPRGKKTKARKKS